MTNSPYERAALAGAALELVSPLIRKSLLNDQGFRDEYGIKAEAMVSIGLGTSLRRSELFDAVRAVLSGRSPANLTDVEDRKWYLTNDALEGELPVLVLSFNQQRLVLPDLSVLAKDASERIRSLKKSAKEVNLPLSAQKEWQSILEERELEDEEIDIFYQDICDTPVHVERTIRNEITAGKSSISSLIPNSLRYYERLVGAYKGSDSIRDYAVPRSMWNGQFETRSLQENPAYLL